MVSTPRFVPPPAWLTLAAAVLLHAVFGTWPDAALPLLGQAAIVVATARLLGTLQVAHGTRWAVLSALLPTMALRTASAGGVFEAALCIAAVEAGIARRSDRMLLCYGAALACDLQAALFVPFVVAWLIRRDVAVWRWGIVPGMVAVALATRWASGWPVVPESPSFGAPNLWSAIMVVAPQQAYVLSGLVGATAVGVAGWYTAHFSVRMPDAARALPVAVLGLLATTGLLPCLGDGSFTLAGIIAFAWAAATAERRAWQIAGLLQFGSLCVFAASLLDAPALIVAGFLTVAGAGYLLIAPLLRPAANDNPIMARAA